MQPAPEIAKDELEHTRRRLAWRASRRGIKEMDIIVGGYAATHLPQMSAAELSQFENMLEIPDQLLLSWLTGQEPVPDDLASPMLLALLAYRPELSRP